MVEATISSSYSKLRSIYLGKERMTGLGLTPGTVRAIAGSSESSVVTEGTLNTNGFLSGLAAIYASLQLAPDMSIGIERTRVQEITITRLHQDATEPVPSVDQLSANDIEPTSETVWQRKRMRAVFIEPFRPENLHTWTPQTEPAVYLVFGMLQEMTDYEYCVGASKQIQRRIGYTAATSPDAILTSRITGEYLVAEFKLKSSQFTLNHHNDDIDVLICWTDDSEERSTLPPAILALEDIAREAVKEKFSEVL